MRYLAALAIVGMSLSACGSDTETPQTTESAYSIVPAGKSDDYFSTVAREYEAQGRVTLTMTPEEFEDLDVRNQRVAERLSAVGVYLTAYLTDKFRGIDINNDGTISDDEVFFQNAEYGGFHAMVRNRSTTVETFDLGEGRYEIQFTVDLAGPSGLLDMLYADGGKLEGDSVSLALRLPAGATGSQDGRPIRSFDPDAYSGELETVDLSVRQLPEVSDAYPYYNLFHADGVYDLTMFFGHDYNAVRSDLQEAREAFDTLVEMGFAPPVGTFDELRPESGAFVKYIQAPRMRDQYCIDDEVLGFVNDPLTNEANLKAAGMRADAARNTLSARVGADGVLQTRDDVYFNTLADLDAVPQVGPATLTALKDFMAPRCQEPLRDVRLEVRLFHSEMFAGARADQREKALNEIVVRDVFFYNGHAGPYYGFYLDEAYEAYIDDDAFATLPMNQFRQQLFVAQGCQTYSQYADMLYANPNKAEDNLDVITTVNYSYGQGTMGLFKRLVQEIDGVHQAVSYRTMMTGLNDNDINASMSVYYGVMGIEANPKIHPYTEFSTIGQPCGTSADCGATEDANLCVNFSDGQPRCVARTLNSKGCPDGTTYADVQTQDVIIGGVCF